MRMGANVWSAEGAPVSQSRQDTVPESQMCNHYLASGCKEDPGGFVRGYVNALTTPLQSVH